MPELTVEFINLKNPVDPFGRDHLLPVSSHVFLSSMCTRFI